MAKGKTSSHLGTYPLNSLSRSFTSDAHISIAEKFFCSFVLLSSKNYSFNCVFKLKSLANRTPRGTNCGCATRDHPLLMLSKLRFQFSVLTTLSVIEPAPARVKSSSKLGFCSLTRGFQFSDLTALRAFDLVQKFTVAPNEPLIPRAK